MVMVCQGLLPWKPDGFFMEEPRKRELDLMIKHIDKDFDFLGLYSGHGGVRMGKSVYAMQDAAYVTDQINRIYKRNNSFNEVDNFAFKGDELIEKAKKLPPYSVIIYDEAGSDLVGRKFMQSTTQALLDFFRECGQLNLFVFCVLPDFFELPRPIAINRASYLVDITFKDGFTRGRFRFFSPRQKKLLYILGKRLLDYDCVVPDFEGNFSNCYTVDEAKYRERKYIALTGRKKDEEEKKSRLELRATNQRDILIKHLYTEHNDDQEHIAGLIGTTQASISIIINKT